MVSVEQAGLGTKLRVQTSFGDFDAVVVPKPFYDPKKKITSA